MKTRCKFQCSSVLHQIHAGKVVGVEVALLPVYSSDPNSENRKFWDATPSGQLKLNLSKTEHVGMFESGKEYFVDISEAA